MVMIGNFDIKSKDWYSDVITSTYLFKVNNKNIRVTSETFSKLTIKTPDWRHSRCSGMFILDVRQVLF